MDPQTVKGGVLLDLRGRGERSFFSKLFFHFQTKQAICILEDVLFYMFGEKNFVSVYVPPAEQT